MPKLRTIGDIEEVLAPPFTLPSAHEGTPVALHTFRHRQPVGLVFVPSLADPSPLIGSLTKILPDFIRAGIALLVIMREPVPVNTSHLVVLIDTDGNTFRRYECPERSACLFAIDRYGAIVWRSTCAPAALEAALQRLKEALEFSEIQCPE
ncbi:MAG: peroxiredoxin family protein [bacterium]|nr:peroxiredoxin family protein [bacterium]